MSYARRGAAIARGKAEAQFYYWQPKFDRVYADLVARDGEEAARALVEANEPYYAYGKAFWNFERLLHVVTVALEGGAQ